LLKAEEAEQGHLLVLVVRQALESVIQNTQVEVVLSETKVPEEELLDQTVPVAVPLEKPAVLVIMVLAVLEEYQIQQTHLIMVEAMLMVAVAVVVPPTTKEVVMEGRQEVLVGLEKITVALVLVVRFV
jgi:hypothetical protein